MEAQRVEPLVDEESAFSKTYDLSDPAQEARAHRDLGDWGRLHTMRHIDPKSNTLTLRFRPHPDSRWRGWESIRRAKILGA